MEIVQKAIVQKIKANNKRRIETGPLQINDDWPGLFIRGDDSFHIKTQLEQVLKRLEFDENKIEDVIIEATLEGLIKMLDSVIVNKG